MIPQIKRVLYATDLSPNSAYAFRYAVTSAIQHGAAIVILHVFELIPASARAMIEPYLTGVQRHKLLEEHAADAKALIENRIRQFSEKELQDKAEFENSVISIEVCEGFPAEVILTKADELNCDAIVMGTHGKGNIGHTFFGSTAKRVLRRTRKPVFIIPLPRGETDITFHDI